jgi:TP901 family phage tail tape measure protein
MALGRSLGTSLVSGGGGLGSLGTLFVRLAADPSNMVRGLAKSESALTGSVARMTGSLAKLSTAFVSAFGLIGAAAVRESIRFETSFAGIKKTMEGTDKEFARLAIQFRALARELPTNVNEINKIGEAAGQLGIRKENLLSFTRTMIDLKNTTNLTSDEAVSDLARLANIVQMPQTEFSRLGSVMVDLGNKFATTENEILTMSMRIAGAGHTVGLSVDQIAGFAAALSSVGVQAELGGTAISHAMIRISKAIGEGGEEIRLYAAVAGRSVESFSKAFKEDAATAMMSFFEGLKKAKDEGLNLFTILEKLNIDEIRLTDITSRAANAHKLFGRALKTSAEAWAQDSALAIEAQKRYGTFESQLRVTWNRIKDVSISVGDALVPALRILNDMFRKATNDGNSFGKVSKDIGRTLAGPLVNAIGWVGDSIQGWKLIFLQGRLGFVELSETAVNSILKINEAMEKMTDGIRTIASMAVGPLAKMTKAFNDQWVGTGGDPNKSPFTIGAPRAPLFNKEDLQAASAALKETGTEIRKELKDTIDTTTRFSTEFKNNYSKAMNEIAHNEEFKAAMVNLNKLKNMWKEAAEIGASTPGSLVGNEVKVGDELKRATGTAKVEKALKKMRMPDMGTAGMRGFDSATEDAFRTKNELSEARTRLKELEDLGSEELLLTDKVLKEKEEMMAAYNERAKQLQTAQNLIVLGAARNMSDDLVDIAGNLAGEQSGIYTAMFAVSKAFAIADATVKIAQGIANAASLGFPLGIIGIAQVVAATSSIISSIQSTKLQFAGARAAGGPVSGGKAYMVGERGPEMFTPSQSGSITSNNKLGGDGVKVVINNFTDVKPVVTERQDGDSRVIEIAMRRVKDEIGAEIREGRGVVSKSMETSYGLRRGRV